MGEEQQVLEYKVFDGLIGSHVTAESPDHGTVELEVVEATLAPGHDRPDRAFSVLFKGSTESFLEQKIYHTDLGEHGSHPLFLVPILEEKDGFVYEAVFTALPQD